MRKAIVTISNLFCGCLAIVAIFTNQPEWIPYFIAISLLADYCDGFLARILKVSSPLGRELDSLADMVSFGLVPGAILFYMFNLTFNIKFEDIRFNQMETMIGVFGFLVTLFSCLRLAKFNLDTRQTEGFVGLNTPACTIFVLGLLQIALYDTYNLQHIVLNQYFLSIMVLVLSYLLVAEMPMFSFKFKALKWKKNEVRWTFLVFSVLCILFIDFGVALSCIILCYVILSLSLWMGGSLKREKRAY
jgi:CDP-diacylglycerol---serine O-phosphatidyltransferase